MNFLFVFFTGHQKNLVLLIADLFKYRQRFTFLDLSQSFPNQAQERLPSPAKLTGRFGIAVKQRYPSQWLQSPHFSELTQLPHDHFVGIDAYRVLGSGLLRHIAKQREQVLANLLGVRRRLPQFPGTG
jgi:hypothetical protein